MKRRASARLGTADKQSPVNALLALSDLHVGSTRGLHPRGFFNTEGNEIKLNEYQERLANLFESKTKEALEYLKGSRFLLLLNGDLIDGQVKRSKQIMSANTDDQAGACLQLLKPLAEQPNCAGVIVTKGTECHTGGAENFIAESLHAIRPPLNKGSWTHDEALFYINGVLVSAAHHMTTTSRAYLEASGMGIMLGNARLAYARDGLASPRVFIRSHRHAPGVFSDCRALWCVLGAWQGLTRHGRKVATDSKPFPTVTAMKFEQPNELPVVKNFGESLYEDPVLKV